MMRLPGNSVPYVCQIVRVTTGNGGDQAADHTDLIATPLSEYMPMCRVRYG